MTNTDSLLSLACKEGEELIEKYIDTEPTRVAMASGNSTLATAIKYLGRAKTKLPEWFEKRCLINSILFEQCSSQIASQAKFEGFSGEVAVDLTCGLGSDSYALSKAFREVHSVEIESGKAEIARYNFTKLGATNITVHNKSAEEFIAQLITENKQVDVIFLDPSRVKDGKKVYSLEDSSPNVVALLADMLRLAKTVYVKLSPLYDTEECFRVFGENVLVSVLSTNNECKEVLVKIERKETQREKSIEHIVINQGIVSRVATPCNAKSQEIQPITELNYLYVPDVAFYKSRCVESYIQTIQSEKDYLLENYIFTKEVIKNDFLGAGYTIEEIEPYKPKQIKALIKSKKIQSAIIHLKNFPYSAEKIRKDLKIKEGSGAQLFATTLDGEPIIVFCKKL